MIPAPNIKHLGKNDGVGFQKTETRQIYRRHPVWENFVRPHVALRKTHPASFLRDGEQHVDPLQLGRVI